LGPTTEGAPGEPQKICGFGENLHLPTDHRFTHRVFLITNRPIPKIQESSPAIILFWDICQFPLLRTWMPKSIYTSEQAKLQLLLRRIRRDAGLTQEDLAAKLKRPQSFVSKYESGERRLDVLELREICSAMNITLIDFVNKMERALRDSGKR
jgi:hypothetical protein